MLGEQVYGSYGREMADEGSGKMRWKIGNGLKWAALALYTFPS